MSLPAPRSSGRWSSEYARTILDASDVSGLSLAEFARRRGLCTQRIRWWRNQLHRETAQANRPHRVELVVAESTLPIPAPAEAVVTVRVRCPSGHVVELVDLAPEQALFAVFHALRLATC